MKYKLILNIVEFKDIENDWRALYEKDKENTVFQSFEFNYFSWIYDLAKAKNTLAIVIAYDSDKIKAILPFYIDRNKKLRFINDLHFDFCDFISIESINFSEVYNYLKQEVDFKSIRLINIKKEANIYNAVSELNIINKVVLKCA